MNFGHPFFPPQPVFLADFKQIKKIQCWPQNDGKALVHLDIEGARQVPSSSTVITFLFCFSLQMEAASSFLSPRQRLSINVPTVSMAENMMDLVDGYCRLEHDTDGTVIHRANKGERGAGSPALSKETPL